MRLSRAAVVGAVAVVVCGGGYAAYAENTGPAASYRTATVTKADVEQTVALSGTISPAGRADLSFPTSGTVTKVGVKVGDTVKAGQVLARLDRVALSAAVTRAQAQLDAAKARLASDEDAQAEAASASASASAAASASAKASSKASSKASAQASPKAAPSSGGPSSGSALGQLKQQQDSVTSAQSAASAALATAKAALADEQQVCTAQASATASASATDSPTSAATADPSSGSSSSTACDDAIAAVQDAQAKVDDAQHDLQKALETLATTLATAASQSSSPSSSPSGATAPSAKPSASASSGSGSDLSSAGGTGGKTVTAATLASDQADIDTARASLVTAQQSLSGSALRAPHSGTVGEIDVAAGDSATAGSTAVVVLSPGATEIELTVTATQVAKLAVGQVAEVTPAGASKALAGTITRITPVPDSNSAYPVTVTLDDDGLELPAGGTAAVDIVVGTADGVLTVPSSAVSNGAVEVLDGTTVTRTRVTTGVEGTTRTEITAGLKAGQQVVLADLNQAVPTSGQQNGLNGRGFAGGGLGGPVTFQAPAGGFAVPKG